MANGCFPSIEISNDLQLTGARVEERIAAAILFCYSANEQFS
ncbi:hypothetical protein [Bacillus sp. X1(2014)]|nr:hypothetical protein [Bacillus sp. X1(2014)]